MAGSIGTMGRTAEGWDVQSRARQRAWDRIAVGHEAAVAFIGNGFNLTVKSGLMGPTPVRSKGGLGIPNTVPL